MRRTAAVCFFAASLSVSQAADRVALARSGAEFQIERAGEIVPGRANVIAGVDAGDTISAGSRALQMDLPSGTSVAVGPYSAVRVREDSQVEIIRGSVAISPSKTEPIGLYFEDLRLTPALDDTAKSAAGPMMLGVAVLDPGRIKVAAANGVFMATHEGESEDQNRTLGVVSNGDSIVYLRRGTEWIVTPEQVGQPTQDRETITYRDDTAVEDDDDDDEAGWLWWAAGGAAAAGILTAALIYEHEDDEDDRSRDRENRRDRDGGDRDDDDDDTGRPPFSIIAPPFGPPFGEPPGGGPPF